MKDATVRIEGLTDLDILELKEQIKGITIEEGETEESADQFNEPISVTTILITLAPQVIGLLALWLSKAREKKKRKLSYKEVKSDGSTKEFELEEEMAKS